jgi:hypothetical protein
MVMQVSLSLILSFLLVLCHFSFQGVLGNNDLSHSHHNDELTLIYQNYNEEYGFDHWMEYGGHYETNIRHLKHRKHFSMLEIGVQSGGSTIVWRRYFTNSQHGTGLQTESGTSTAATDSTAVPGTPSTDAATTTHNERTYSYVGLDINPNCKQFERLNENVRIVTGSQDNSTLLLSLCEVS